jgi:hypothetical protein
MSNEGGDGSDPSNSNGGPNHPTGGPSGPNNNGNNPNTWVPHTNDGDNEKDYLSNTDPEFTDDINSSDDDYGRGRFFALNLMRLIFREIKYMSWLKGSIRGKLCLRRIKIDLKQ